MPRVTPSELRDRIQQTGRQLRFREGMTKEKRTRLLCRIRTMPGTAPSELGDSLPRLPADRSGSVEDERTHVVAQTVDRVQRVARGRRFRGSVASVLTMPAREVPGSSHAILHSHLRGPAGTDESPPVPPPASTPRDMFHPTRGAGAGTLQPDHGWQHRAPVVRVAAMCGVASPEAARLCPPVANTPAGECATPNGMPRHEVCDI